MKTTPRPRPRLPRPRPARQRGCPRPCPRPVPCRAHGPLRETTRRHRLRAWRPHKSHGRGRPLPHPASPRSSRSSAWSRSWRATQWSYGDRTRCHISSTPIRPPSFDAPQICRGAPKARGQSPLRP
ncbi:hypothetical protein DR046_19700 [Jannaschia formosa]|nr:hypothetical protein DR046_19700 [Jannaschia formosa]